ncbi:15-hydroxyprostaglandin dehydrogenase [NAD(+)]-like [Dendronephthya gigantea]|uniref:15-hydroxyprostaglandin dehydrogenase [NAD(+)]-like n=1 Tax=Dendronephthya gigantea TaxID=151771 RepID=UPI00106C2464|nr:15-hydroxyprostaglandin dehydrogenase [NAD(+)]-like [Dendronephthya gigantea]
MAAYKAIVTGGAKGIGYALTSAIVAAGGKARFLDVLAAEGVKAQKTLDETYGRGNAVFVQCDVTKKDELRAAFSEAKSQMDGVNVVFNNAGVISLSLEDEKSRYEEIMAINLGGVISGSIFGLELMGKGYGGDGGVIINTASFAAFIPPFFPHLPVYSAVKTGVVQFTRCLAQTSLAEHNVRVNCVCPHGVWTDMLKSNIEHDQKKLAQLPQEQRDKMNAYFEEVSKQFLEPTDVSNEVMKLIKDKSKNDQVLSIARNPNDPAHIIAQNHPTMAMQQ